MWIELRVVESRREKVRHWFISLLPRWVVYDCVIRAAVTGEGGAVYSGNPSERTCEEVLRTLEGKPVRRAG